MSKEFIKGTGAETETAPVVQDKEFTAEESKTQMRANEEDFIQGLLEAADFKTNDTQKIEIARNGKVLFTFTVRALSTDEYDACRKRHTKYVRNKQLGLKMPEETDRNALNNALIYLATIEQDQERLWDNPKVWKSLESKGTVVVTGTDVIDFTLKPGEKDKVIEIISRISGYEDDNLEEVAKN